MAKFPLFMLAAAVLQTASAANLTNLYVSSYDGNVTSLSLTKYGSGYNLSITFRDQSCAPSPSWLTWDKENRALYCLDEGNTTPNGSVTAYTAGTDGKLTMTQHLNLTAPAPVNGVIFGDKDFRAYAVAHYTGQVATLAMPNATSFSIAQQLNFTGITPTGPNTDRQATPHEHEAVLDPTGQYILVPDLGADLVHVFCWAPVTDNNTLLEHPSLKVSAGSGPRHAAFWSPDGPGANSTNQYLLVVTELGNTLTSYRVDYLSAGGLNFTEVYTTNTFGGAAVPIGAAASEVVVSPDNRFVLVSNRNDSSFYIDNFDPKNSTIELSDSFATYAINNNGTLSFKQLWPAGGSFPRQFSINKAGDLVAVGLQNSARVVVLQRDIESGFLGQAVANSIISGQPTCVVWDE
jgi:6-phosphogluconolactonase (cycloisomerase 2 family)